MTSIPANFGLKVLAVALAIVGWAYFRFASNPVFAAHFDTSYSVPITAINVPFGFVAHLSEKETSVQVRARRDEQPMKPEAMQAVVDVSGKGPGAYSDQIHVTTPDGPPESVNPSSVTYTIEKLALESFPVTLRYSSLQSGIVVERAQMTPETVTVQGPASTLSLVAAVRLDVTMPNGAQTFDQMVRPVLVNAAGAEVPGLQISPNVVRAHIIFRSVGGKH